MFKILTVPDIAPAVKLCIKVGYNDSVCFNSKALMYSYPNQYKAAENNT